MPNYEFCRTQRRRHTLYNTHGTLHFCINDVIKITQVASPSSHQFWLHEAKALNRKQTKEKRVKWQFFAAAWPFSRLAW
jgi:hypothetical protein